MKLKEKLAKTYDEDECSGEHISSPFSCYASAYLAGFEKARGMAIQLPQHFHGDDGYIGSSYIRELGEEEVHDI